MHIILLLIIFIIILLLFCKVGIQVFRKNGMLTVKIKVFSFWIKVYPLVSTSKKQIDSSKSKENEQEKDSASKKFLDIFKDRKLMSRITDVVFDIINAVCDKVLIKRLNLKMIFASDDAAKTGIMLGAAFSLSGIIIPLIEQNFNVKNHQIVLDADFNKQEIEYNFDFICLTRPFHILVIFLRFRKQLLRLQNDLSGLGGE